MTMKPLTNWTMRNYRDAKSLMVNGEGNRRQREGTAAKMALFESDMQRGWNPAQGDETGVPVSNVDSWDAYHGQALSSPRPISVKPPPAYTMSGDDIAATATADAASYGQNIPNASQRLSLRAKPVYAHKENKGAPYMYSEPTVAQLKAYLERNIAAVDDPRYQMHWRSAMRSLETEGEGGETFKELSDRAWMEARRVTAKHRGAIIRMKYAGDDADTSWIDNASAQAVSAMEPTLYALDAAGTLGITREALGALEENTAPEPGMQAALRELEEAGIILPPRERTRATMEDSLMGQIVGTAGSFLLPHGGAMGLVGKTADRLVKATGAVPKLLRGTHLGPSVTGTVTKAPASLAGKAVAGGLAGAGEAAGLAGVRKGVDELKGGGSDVEMLPTSMEGLMLGAAGGMGLGILGKGGKASRKSMRKGSGQVAKDLGVLEEHVGGPATRFWSGYTTTPAMDALEEAALTPKRISGSERGGQFQTHKFTPGGIALRRMTRPTMQRGLQGELRTLEVTGKQNRSFWKKHVGAPSYMQRAAESMIHLVRKRSYIPFADDEAARKAFVGVSEPRFATSPIDEDRLLQGQGGGTVLSWEEARKLYGDDALNARAAKDLAGLTKEELAGVTVVAKPRLLTPEQYDNAIWALDRKINWESKSGRQDPVWAEVRNAISQDRVDYGKGWDTMKKRHHEMFDELEARARSVGLPPSTEAFRGAGEKDVQSVHDALKGSMGPDASDEAMMRLLGDPLERSRGFRVKPEDRARHLKENPSELKPPSEAPLLERWNTARAVEARERLRPLHDEIPGSRPGVIRMLYKGSRPRVDAAAGSVERASPGSLGALGGLYQHFMAEERAK